MDYSKVNIYFNLDDPITKDLLDTIIENIRDKDVTSFNKLDQDLSKIMETNNNTNTVMLDNEYCISIYQTVFNAAYESNIDVTPILFDTVVRHDLKNLTEKKVSEYLENISYKDISVDILKEKLSEYLSDVKNYSIKYLLKQVVSNTKELSNIKNIAKWTYNTLSKDKKEDLNDFSSVVSTLVNYSGTIQSAKDLVNRYI